MQNVPSAYLVPSAVYEKMTEIIEEYHLSKAVDAALASGEKPVKVSLDELWVRVLVKCFKGVAKAWQKILKYLLFKFTTTSQIQKI